MEFNELLKDLLYGVITTVIPVLTYYLVKFLNQVFQNIKQKTQDSVISNTINESMELISKVVSCTSQTYVDTLKKQGNFTAESQKIAFEMTKNTIIDMLSEESKSILSSVYQDLDTWVTVQIESAVNSQK